MAVSRWKPYLQLKKFAIITNQRSLVHLIEQKIQEGMQQKAFIKHLGVQYKIIYKKGQENKAAYALSRRTSTAKFFVVFVSTPNWLEIVIEGYQQDQKAKDLLT